MSDTGDTQSIRRTSSFSAPRFAEDIVESTLDEFSGPLDNDGSLHGDDGRIEQPEDGIFATDKLNGRAAVSVESMGGIE